jgi:hypothetical protein
MICMKNHLKVILTEVKDINIKINSGMLMMEQCQYFLEKMTLMKLHSLKY